MQGSGDRAWGAEAVDRAGAGGPWGLDLHWIPLGAGTPVVQASGRLYEALVAGIGQRPRHDLYHAALVARTPGGSVFVEVTPVPRRGSPASRGVVGGGPVGARALGALRVFRYEVRRWPDGSIPDLHHAVGGALPLATERAPVLAALDLVARVPTPTWGRDELRAGEMWNSNSVVSWTLTRAGLLAAAGRPPPGGRAPGWDAGVRVARRDDRAPVAPTG